MIESFQSIPVTRRRFGAALLTGAATGAEFLALRKEAKAAARAPFTICLVPDPQYLAGDATCSGSAVYNALIQWAITNRNLSVNGVALNIKGFVGVGDCANTVSDTVYDTQQQNSVNAYALAEAASPRMFVTRCPGNHDYVGGASTIDRSTIGYMWRTDKTGAWRPAALAAIYGSGMDLGNGDVAFWGGSYTDDGVPDTSANNYMKLWIQGMRIGVISLEFAPSSTTMAWAKGIHDANPDYQWFVMTHCYQDTSGAQITRGSTYGPATYSLADAPASNSGTQMWSGASGHTGLTSWDNLTMVGCGHWVNGYVTPTSSNWVYQRLESTSTSNRGQTVQQIFCNCQGGAAGPSGDYVNYCSSNPATPNGTSDTGHLLLMRFDPVTQMMEQFLVSTNSGKWTGGPTGTNALTGNNASPIQLCNVSMPSRSYLFPAPGALR